MDGYPVKKKSYVAVALIGLLLGIGNAGAMVLCFGADGHIEVVSASEEHCCECPSHATPGETGHRCGPCFDIPLPLGRAEAFLLPPGSEGRDRTVQAESGVCGRDFTLISPDSTEASPGVVSCAHKSAVSSSLLGCPVDLKAPSSIFHRSVPPFRMRAMCRLFRPVRSRP